MLLFFSLQSTPICLIGICTKEARLTYFKYVIDIDIIDQCLISMQHHAQELMNILN